MSLALLLLALLLAACGASSPDGAQPVESLPTEAKAANGEFISWHEHRIDDEGKGGGIELRGGVALATADFDADGHPDFVSAFDGSAHIRIAYGSDDADTWSRLSLAEGDEVRGVADVSAGDLNGDGRPDLILACRDAHLLYLQNPASEHHGFRWQRIVPALTSGRGAWTAASFADLDGDGRPEVLAANTGGGKLSWFSIQGDPLQQSSWEEHLLADVEAPQHIQAADLDGDGDLDIFAAGEQAALWLENVTVPGAELAFEQHAVTPTARSISGAAPVLHDFSGDGRLDAAMIADSSRIVWLEQPASAAAAWTSHDIGEIAPDELSGLTLADMDQDGDPDLFAGSASQGPSEEDSPETVDAQSPAGRVVWFQNPGQTGGEWTRHDLLRRERGRYAAWTALDLDGDSDLDIVGTRGASGTFDGLVWFEQRRSAAPIRRLVGIREKDSRGLPLP